MPKLDGFEVLELIDPGPRRGVRHRLRRVRAQGVRGARGRLPAQAVRARAAERSARAGASPRAPRAGAGWCGGTATGACRCARPLAAAARRPGQFVERLLVKDGANVHVIPAEKLDYLEAQDDYVAIHCRLARPTSGAERWPSCRPGSIPTGSCASIARSCSTSSAWAAWNCMPKTAAWRSSPTAASCR